MFDGFDTFTITTQDEPHVSIFGIRSGDAKASDRPPLLLLHGFPQSHHIWHRVATQIKDKYNLVIIDLRGYGNSSKPADVSQYVKSLMACDCIKVMDELGINGPFFICAHDRGARAAHKLCVDYPDRVRKAIFLDICPTLAMYTLKDPNFAKTYWHWFFLIQKEPLPETLISASARQFAELFMGGRQKSGLDIFEKESLDNYVLNLEDPETIHSMCQDYRASATLDLEETREDLKHGRLLQSPLRVLWARHGVIGKYFHAIQEWKAVSNAWVDGHDIDSGHYLPENVPDEVVSNILEFLR
ncbi:haloacetate dehalogenase [Trichoderma arundinaceum]|uniref:Haloacetate dehalogenase n=1 Tax=Trichoderma arundinaceum TaxID=490622 RepID=A0A395NRM1_TRIAR|nr:haloacetate dehalogenase [Trichoderma arundinaceum]